MRSFLGAFLAIFVAIGGGFAQDPGRECHLGGPTYQLTSDTVVWSMTIGSGQSCVRGLRSAWATLDNIKLVIPPQSGSVTLEGLGFIYKVNPDFRGQDAFAFLVTGKFYKVSGSSTIRVEVSVR